MKTGKLAGYVTVFIAAVIFYSCKKDNPTPAPSPTGADTGKYFSKVKTIIQAHCTITCHAPSKGFYEGLPVTFETDSIIARSAFGIKAALVDSPTIWNKRMPPNETLAATDIETVLKWCAKGGKVMD